MAELLKVIYIHRLHGGNLSKDSQMFSREGTLLAIPVVGAVILIEDYCYTVQGITLQDGSDKVWVITETDHRAYKCSQTELDKQHAKLVADGWKPYGTKPRPYPEEKKKKR